MSGGTINRAILWTAGGMATWMAGRAAWQGLRAYRFAGQVALVTGGSRGLGLLLARRLVREGARVAICARDGGELQRAAAEFDRRGREVLAIPCNIANKDEVERMVRSIADRWGPVDVLFNNAGVIQTGPLETMTEDDFREAMDIHFWGSLHAINAVLPAMRQRRQGRIVNIASIGGKLSMPHMLPYCASKFALAGLSQGLRAELAKDGIVVTTVCPGTMRTGSPRNAKFKGQHRAEYAWFSITDSMPLLSMDGDRAARRILAACRRGEAELMVSLPARAASLFHGLFPGLTADLLGWLNRLLPGPGGIGTQAATGSQSTSAWSPSVLTALSEWAAARNNEISPNGAKLK